MLSHITVTDIALVDHMELELERQMTVVTGETGAGKSILLDALGLALGDRAEAGIIATASEKAEITATFDLGSNQAALAFLEDRDLLGTDPECILRRVVSRDGRSRGFINGIPCTVSDMKALGELLIDIHSQHEHQSLLRRDTHRHLLDAFGDLSKKSTEVEYIAENYRTAQRTLDDLIESNEAQAARLQLLNYQSEELAALNVTEGEVASLEQEQRLLANAEAIIEASNQGLTLISDNEEGNALAFIGRAIQHLSGVDQPGTNAIVELLESSRIQLDEAAHDLTRFIGNLEIDPSRLREVDDRLGAIHDIARKHRIKPDQVPALYEQICEEIKALTNIDEQVKTTRARLDEYAKQYDQAAKGLSRDRKQTAKKLAAAVSTQLERLGMKGSVFEVALRPRQAGAPHSHGLEEIEFEISTNPGQAPRPLGKIASGGELSRISLAIQVVTANTSPVPTLVFDEVDVGIGGATAEVVGSLLRTLSEKAQIICVTHLPQVAVQGHHHLLVTKANKGKQARTAVTALSESERIAEVARMLGGVNVTGQSMAHAEEMYWMAQRQKDPVAT